MARNTTTIDYREDYYRGFAKFYFEKILETIIKFGQLDQETGLILDYGCGVGHLKKMLGQKPNIVGYDIIPELSEIADYRSLQPVKIVLSGVLEHLSLMEIESLIQDFLKMNRSAELLVFLPTENIISRLAMFFTGQTNAHDDHISKYQDINKILEKYYHSVERKYIFSKMAQVTRYLPN
jgi:hypothetical protein